MIISSPALQCGSQAPDPGGAVGICSSFEEPSKHLNINSSTKTNLAVPLSVVIHRNIMALLNAFDLPIGNITESNYEEALHQLNSTAPSVIQELNLKTCDLQDLLSQVRLHHLLGSIWIL